MKTFKEFIAESPELAGLSKREQIHYYNDYISEYCDATMFFVQN